MGNAIQLNWLYFMSALCILKAFSKTEIELRAIAKPAIIGFNNPNDAIGIPNPL